MIESADPALKGYRALREIKEPSRDAQCTDPLTGSPRPTNLISLATARHRRAANVRTSDDVVWLDEKLDSPVRNIRATAVTAAFPGDARFRGKAGIAPTLGNVR